MKQVKKFIPRYIFVSYNSKQKTRSYVRRSEKGNRKFIIDLFFLVITLQRHELVNSELKLTEG